MDSLSSTKNKCVFWAFPHIAPFLCVNKCDKHFMQQELHTQKLPDPWAVHTVAVFTYSSLRLSLFRPQLVFSTPRDDSLCGQRGGKEPSVQNPQRSLRSYQVVWLLECERGKQNGHNSEIRMLAIHGFFFKSQREEESPSICLLNDKKRTIELPGNPYNTCISVTVSHHGGWVSSSILSDGEVNRGKLLKTSEGFNGIIMEIIC